MRNKDENAMLDDQKFYDFLNRTTAFVWAYALTNPGVNALRTPVYAEMVNIVEGKDVTFEEYKFDEVQFRSVFGNYQFLNGRPLTKSMITWYAFNNMNQKLLSLETVFEIEHIYAKNRYEKEKSLSKKEVVESLGNKVLLEKRINIRASDYRFEDKIKYYNGFETVRGVKEGTNIIELKEISRMNDFTENDINQRYKAMLDSFVEYLRLNNLVK